MKFATTLALALALVMGGVHAQQSAEEIDRARAARAREMQDSDAGVHAQHAADAPRREAQRRWHESHRPWRLLVFHAFRPGILSLCANAHQWPDFERLAMPEAADPLKARWLAEAAPAKPFSNSAQPAGNGAPGCAGKRGASVSRRGPSAGARSATIKAGKSKRRAE